MTLKLRRMRPYHPRKRNNKQSGSLEKQELRDLHHKLSRNVGRFIVLIEEGNETQILEAQQKARNDLLKYGDEMRKLAEKIGEKYTQSVSHFLKTLDTVVHTKSGWIDTSLVRRYYEIGEKLEKELAA